MDSSPPKSDSPPRPSEPRGHFAAPALILAAFFGGYLLLDWVSYIHPMQKFNVTPWNPQPALAIALLMTRGQRWLPAVFAAILAAEYLVRGGSATVPATFLVSAVLSLGYAAIARALTSVFAIGFRLSTRRDMIRLIGVVTAGAFLTGVIYVGALFASGIGPPDHYLDALLRFWIGDSVGVLVTLPVLLMMLDPVRRAQVKAMLSRKETLAQGAAIMLALWAVFGQTASEQFKFFYLLFLPLVWVAARSGMVGAVVAAVIIQGGVILSVQAVAYQTLTVFELQALLMALAITGFFLGVTVDERQRAAEELRQSLKLAAAGEMAAALAHELNQPLTALLTYAKATQLLVESPDGSRQQLVDTLQKLAGEAKRAADVVRRLRDFFRTGAAQLHEVSLPGLVGEVLESLNTRAASHGISVQYRVAGQIPDMLLDPLQIEVVMRNLIANAFDAVMQADGPKSVIVEIAPDKSGQVRVSVRDNGPGITPDRAESLFEPFSTTKATGMGMGLTISRAIVEAHGGRLWVEPGAQGVLCFTLPTREATHG